MAAAPTPSVPAGGPPRRQRASGPVRADVAEVVDARDAERVLAAHGIAARLGRVLDGQPEFLRGATSAMIDAHERYPVLREGRWPLQQIEATSTLVPGHPLRGALPDGALAADAWGGGMHVVLLNENTPQRAHELATTDHAAAVPGMFVPAQRTSYGLVMHEMGHATARAEYGIDGHDLIIDHADHAGFATLHDVAAVSNYAASEPHEFFAESFAQRNMPEGWTAFDAQTRARLERFADSINSVGRVIL